MSGRVDCWVATDRMGLGSALASSLTSLRGGRSAGVGGVESICQMLCGGNKNVVFH
jgi:hypothetical protein